MTHDKILDMIIEQKRIIFNDLKSWRVSSDPDNVMPLLAKFHRQGYKASWRFGRELNYWELRKTPDKGLILVHKFLRKGYQFRSDYPELPIKIMVREIWVKNNEPILIYENPEAGYLYGAEEREYMNKQRSG